MLKKAADDAFVGRWVYPASDDPLAMVGRNGVHDLDWLSGYIAKLLRLSSSDVVLDLGCGNGILAILLAPKVKYVVGVDFSETLLSQASRIASAPNIEYRQADARVVSSALENRKFDKVLISSTFQYFDAPMARNVLGEIRKLLAPNGLVCVMDIPDQSRKFAHYIRTARRLVMPAQEQRLAKRRYSSARSRLRSLFRYAAHLLGLGSTSDLGWWWRRNDFAALANSCGFDVETLDQPEKIRFMDTASMLSCARNQNSLV